MPVNLWPGSAKEASNGRTHVVTKSAPNVAQNPGAQEFATSTGSSTTPTFGPGIPSLRGGREEAAGHNGRKQERGHQPWIDAHVNISQHVTVTNWPSNARRVPVSSLFLTIMILPSTSPGPRFYVNIESYDKMSSRNKDK